MLSKVAVRGLGGIDVVMDMGPITIITGAPGSGKSLIIEVLWRLLSRLSMKPLMEILDSDHGKVEVHVALRASAKERLTKALGREVAGDELVISIDLRPSSAVQVVKLGDWEVLVAEYGDGLSRLRKPVDVEIKDASSILDPLGLEPTKPSPMELLDRASEDYEVLLALVKALGHVLREMGVYRLGPFIEYGGTSREMGYVGDYVGRHGEYTVNVLAKLFADPSRDGEVKVLNKIIGEMGFRGIRAGWYGGNLVISYVDKRGFVKIGADPPCHLKAILAIATQAIAAPNPSIVFVENADYCMDEQSSLALAKVLAAFVGSGKQFIMEVRNKWLIESLRLPHVIVNNIA